jgi:hypothetical protein
MAWTIEFIEQPIKDGWGLAVVAISADEIGKTSNPAIFGLVVFPRSQFFEGSW